MKVLLDHREANIVDIVRQICNQTEIIQLPLADILVVGDEHTVAVERKTVPDFVSSIRSNRLWEQLLRLMKTESILEHKISRRLLIIHGNFEEYLTSLGDPDISKFWASMMGAFMEILFVYDTPLLFASDDDKFATFLRILIQRECRHANDNLPPSRWYRKNKSNKLPTKDRKLYVLDSIPLIGEAQAKSLIEHFSSIQRVANASIVELQDVPKIGKKKAKLIFDTFH